MAAVFYKTRFAPVDRMSVHGTEEFREALINPSGIYQRARGVARTHIVSKSVTGVAYFGGASLCRINPSGIYQLSFQSDLPCRRAGIARLKQRFCRAREV